MICVGLRVKFYIVTALLACMVVFGWYGVWFWSVNEIMMEDAPMSAEMKTLFAVLMALIVSSWTLSLFALFRQILVGAAFTLDRNGIHTTATAIIVLAFIIVVPVKRIPFDAIRSLREEDGVLVATLDNRRSRSSRRFVPSCDGSTAFSLALRSRPPSSFGGSFWSIRP